VTARGQPASIYVPDRGDLVWLTFDPQAGHAPAGRQPAIILSPASYNRRSRLALACPITNQIKGYPFEVVLPPGLPITGAVLADHLRSVDWQARQAGPAGEVSPDVLQSVLARIAPLLGLR